MVQYMPSYGGALSNPSGAPDGTGLRFSYLQGVLCARPAFALWMAHLASHKRSPFLAWWFLTRILTGQCKTDDQGRYPAEPADIKSARPISRLLILRAGTGLVGCARVPGERAPLLPPAPCPPRPGLHRLSSVHGICLPGILRAPSSASSAPLRCAAPPTLCDPA